MKQLFALNLFLLSCITAKAYGTPLASESAAETAGRLLNVTPFTRRIFRSVYAPPPLPSVSTTGLSLDQLPVTSPALNLNNLQSRLRTPRNYLIPYRRFRRVVPTEIPSSNFLRHGRTDIDDPTSSGQLRFLGWLFGRPNYYSRYPNYSILEDAAGIGPYSSSRFPSSSLAHSNSPVIIEDCTELLDPITHEIIEECHEVPAAVVPLH